ncbi:MAG TPA: choline kinase family protein [Jatrophihabitans sp.]|nr:choline kinase family protein [Jatrophihabitans sp.]
MTEAVGHTGIERSSDVEACPDGLPAALLDTVEQLRGHPRTVETLPGGLTNVNYKVTTPAGCFVVRHFTEDASALAIDRRQEYRNSVRAAAIGVGAPVVAFVPGQHLLVVGFIEGTTLTNASFHDAGLIPRVAQSIRTLHSAEPFDTDFDMFAIQRRYLSIVQANGYQLPAGYLDFSGHVDRLAAALAHRPMPRVPCNNDLLAGNFIDDGSRIRIIDYEYSGNNDACFELGNVWSECELSLDQLAELVTCYFGRSDRQLIARAELQGLMSKYGWTLWGSIQASISRIDYDFFNWGLQRFIGAAALFSSRRFDRLLDQAAGYE